MTATYSFAASPGQYAQVIQHVSVFDIDILSSLLSEGVYTIITSDPLPPEQLAHLGLTEVS